MIPVLFGSFPPHQKTSMLSSFEVFVSPIVLCNNCFVVCRLGVFRSGQLGLGHNFTAKEQTPQKVPSLSRAKVSQLACGQDHTAVLTSESQQPFDCTRMHIPSCIASLMPSGRWYRRAAPCLLCLDHFIVVLPYLAQVHQHSICIFDSSRVCCYSSSLTVQPTLFFPSTRPYYMLVENQTRVNCLCSETTGPVRLD